MSLLVSSLNSGSNGNCYYAGNHDEAVLIDAGISCRETEKRLKRLGLSVRKIKAIFVSHEHGDHVHGIPALSRKYKIPVYITSRTLENGKLELKEELIRHFHPHESVEIGGLRITGFPKLHDACDPHSFIVSSSSVSVGVFTDIGMACQHVKKYFQQCHAAFLEANYDEWMLDNGPYPYMLKERIRGGKGHLSNMQAARLFTEHRPDFMSHLFLSHLSAENNRPKIVQDVFSKVAGETELVIAPRNKETKLIHIRSTPSRKSFRRTVDLAVTEQLSLF